jgi:MraZ protein
VLRGNYTAKIDDKGRLKIPNAFRSPIEGQHGADVFVTSLTGEYVRIYPMPVWMALEEKMTRVPSTHPARLKFFDRVNYYGQTAAFDNQGRVIIHPRLRESAGMAGEVDVFGQYDYLDVWNHERFVAKMHREPYTDDDARALAELGI